MMVSSAHSSFPTKRRPRSPAKACSRRYHARALEETALNVHAALARSKAVQRTKSETPVNP